jgi:hypothetical protein
MNAKPQNRKEQWQEWNGHQTYRALLLVPPLLSLETHGSPSQCELAVGTPSGCYYFDSVVVADSTFWDND